MNQRGYMSKSNWAEILASGVVVITIFLIFLESVSMRKQKKLLKEKRDWDKCKEKRLDKTEE